MNVTTRKDRKQRLAWGCLTVKEKHTAMKEHENILITKMSLGLSD